MQHTAVSTECYFCVVLKYPKSRNVTSSPFTEAPTLRNLIKIYFVSVTVTDSTPKHCAQKTQPRQIQSEQQILYTVTSLLQAGESACSAQV
jgi:hypothetical protein